jgi:hypothetical protein
MVSCPTQVDFTNDDLALASTAILPPWIENHYSLVSWWSMQKFSASAFFSIGRYLVIAKRNIQDLIDAPNGSRNTAFSLNSTANDTLVSIKTLCSQIGLTVSTKCAASLLKMQTLGLVMDGIGQLENTITWELEDRLFMHIPPDRATRYNQRELFGKDVNDKFQDIQFDVVEAGNCYATGRSTAVVFHLMRIMEIAVQQFGTKLGVSLASEKNWQNILDEINKAIQLLPKTPQRVDMSQAAANLYAVKLAWRNEVMHPKDTYTLEEADNLIRQVKIFMEQLARII